MLTDLYQRNCIKEIKQLCEYFPVIGIIGSRQVGKTTLVKMLSSGIIKQILYLDLENPVDFNKLQSPELFFQKHDEKCIIIDEIQRYPEIFQYSEPFQTKPTLLVNIL